MSPVAIVIDLILKFFFLFFFFSFFFLFQIVCRKDKQERAEGQGWDHDPHAEPGASRFLGGTGGAAGGDQETRPWWFLSDETQALQGTALNRNIKNQL